MRRNSSIFRYIYHDVYIIHSAEYGGFLWLCIISSWCCALAGNRSTADGTREERVQKESRTGEREGTREVGHGEDGNRKEVARRRPQGNFPKPQPHLKMCALGRNIFAANFYKKCFFSHCGTRATILGNILFVYFQPNSEEVVRPRTREEYEYLRQKDHNKPARYKTRQLFLLTDNFQPLKM